MCGFIVAIVLIEENSSELAPGFIAVPYGWLRIPRSLLRGSSFTPNGRNKFRSSAKPLFFSSSKNQKATVM